MSITFNAEEVFEMAEEIESNGMKFYRQAAEKATDESVKKLLFDMSSMEAKHLKIFKEMREQLSDEEKEASTYDPDNEATLYLQTMADARGWEGLVSPGKELTGQESPREIFEIALNSEKESVVFYFGLKSMVPESAGKDKVEKIILEELAHISTLLEHLKSLN